MRAWGLRAARRRSRGVLVSVLTGICTTGCGVSESWQALPPPLVEESAAVGQRDYFDVPLEELRSAALDSLETMNFAVDREECKLRGRLLAFVITARRPSGTEVRILIEAMGGGEKLVAIRVTPPNPTLVRAVHEELERRLTSE
jgi:hypothetical protein